MAKSARKNYEGFYGYQQPYPAQIETSRPALRPIPPQKKVAKKRKNLFVVLLSYLLMTAIGIFVIPYGFDRIAKPLLFGNSYSEVTADYNELYSPTSNYISNDILLNTRLLSGVSINKKSMKNIYTSGQMVKLEAQLTQLMKSYGSIQPSIYVWDYDTGKYADINGSKIYSAASIIKIPVLIQLFKSIEAGQLTIYDEMELAPYFKAEGSGDLKKMPTNTIYTIDELAKVMIQKSDNSATNMIMTATGGMPNVNRGIRSWGLSSTQVNNWLPDMAGTNYTTAKDLAKMLYNLDDPNFLTLNSREYIIDYMSHVENNRLIQAGLPSDALFVHKTGDIGKMLGDAGIVFAPNGKKYIVVILVNRPYNSPMGKNFINKASSIIYNSVISGDY